MSPVLYRCEITSVVYIYAADGEVPDDFEAERAVRDDMSDPDVFCVPVRSLADVPNDVRDSLPHGIDGDVSIADLAATLWPSSDATVATTETGAGT